ncbi:MAG TPA: methyltransferase domain-containing protein [Stenotrophobium sp.]|jgi:protein arginine N-methyltransferase 1|nr:methyltransferase domain-containing protein [Stenotrophobium sp.]
MSEIELHRKLLGDAARNRAFHQALEKVIRPGKTTVVDLGAGTGFLSFMARRLGARHCTLIEYADTLDLAEALARKNRLDALTFIKAHSSEITRPPKADLVISETLGNYALEENLLETLVDARRFLNTKGLIIPGRLLQFVAPVVTSTAQDEIDIWPQVGFGLDLTAARAISLNNMFVRTLHPAELAGEHSARLWDDLDFNPAATAPASKRSCTVKWSAKDLSGATQVFGYALWWECELVPGVVISTSPYAPPTHWQQIYLPLLEPLTLRASDALEVTLGSDTRPQVGVRVAWRTRQVRGGRAVNEQSQDIFRGRL